MHWDLSFLLKAYYTLREVCFSIGTAPQFNYSRLSSPFMRFIGAQEAHCDLYQHILPCQTGMGSYALFRKIVWLAKILWTSCRNDSTLLAPQGNIHHPTNKLLPTRNISETCAGWGNTAPHYIFFFSYTSQATALNFQSGISFLLGFLGELYFTETEMLKTPSGEKTRAFCIFNMFHDFTFL